MLLHIILLLGVVGQSKERNISASIEHQNLEEAPPFPILDIGLHYILGQYGENSSKSENNSILQFFGLLPPVPSPAPTSIYQPLNQIKGPIQCSATSPCLDGSCCNSEGKCGYTAWNCEQSPNTFCVRDCKALAMCGVNSLNGAQHCPLNLCCSYFGYCGIHCASADPAGTMTPCQEDYGRCEVISPPSCASFSTSNGRKVGYYQAGAVYSRACNRISPSQINTNGLTHLNFAFASIDPTTFRVIPKSPLDVILYAEFTALKTSTLQTWIAIGGFDFNNPGITHTTFSDMVATPANRAAFINSLIAFMERWGFQGADLDWEFPSQSSRGGRPEDATNLVFLVKDMRTAFGTKFGLSSVLPPDFGYLAGQDPVGMSHYVDFFNFMAYDLHGPWEAEYLGATVRPQTSVIDIDSFMLPLWYVGVPPSKINLGIAYYGRGYTLASSSCRDVGCPYIGGNKGGICTASQGVLSLREISQIIQNGTASPKLLPDLMIKQISWDDQWIGYDDDETIALKSKWGDRHCLGGTAIWSIDFNSGSGSGDTPLIKSVNGSCGKGIVCTDAPFGACCSSHNFCGSTLAHCSPSNGCQLEYGTCILDNAAPSPVIDTSISKDGTCGNGRTCTGSVFGKCCSPLNQCGSSLINCSPSHGCQPKYGICVEAGGGITSTTGTCGNGITCQNSQWGDCCSGHGYCGNSGAYCSGADGCQPEWGTCQS